MASSRATTPTTFSSRCTGKLRPMACVVGEPEDGSRMLTLAKWRDGAIAEEHIWI